MTFHFACRKLQRSKDLEPAGPDSWILNRKYRSQSQSQRSAVFWRNPASYGRTKLCILTILTNISVPPSYGGNHELWTMNYEPFTSIENPTLAHFRHFRHFSSLFTNLPAYKAADIYVPIRHYICRESSTNHLLFMQNKPNVKDA